MTLGYSPELPEFLRRDLTITVKVYLVKEFTRRQLAKRALPMFKRLITIYLIATVFIEYFECPINLFNACLTQCLEKLNGSIKDIKWRTSLMDIIIHKSNYMRLKCFSNYVKSLSFLKR